MPGARENKECIKSIYRFNEVFLQWTFEPSLERWSRYNEAKGNQRNTPAKPTAAGERAGPGEHPVYSAIAGGKEECIPVTWSSSLAKCRERKLKRKSHLIY